MYIYRFPLGDKLISGYHGGLRFQACGADVLYVQNSIFRVPLEPFLPGLGIALNFYLVAQLSWLGLGLILLYTAAAGALYVVYGHQHSIGQNGGWGFSSHAHHIPQVYTHDLKKFAIGICLGSIGVIIPRYRSKHAPSVTDVCLAEARLSVKR